MVQGRGLGIERDDRHPVADAAFLGHLGDGRGVVGPDAHKRHHGWVVDECRADVVTGLGEVHLVAHAIGLGEAAADRLLEAVHPRPRVVVVGEARKLHVAARRLATALEKRFGRCAEQPAALNVVGADVERPGVAKRLAVHVTVDRDHLHSLSGEVLHLLDDRRILSLDDRDGHAGHVGLAAELPQLFDLPLRRGVVLLHHDPQPLRLDAELLCPLDQTGIAGIPEGIIAIGDEDQTLGSG